MNRSLVLLASLLLSIPALAEAPQRKGPRPQEVAPTGSGQRSLPEPRPEVAKWVRPCQGLVPQRSVWPQGTLLWGTGRKAAAEERSSVLTSVDLEGVRRDDTVLKGVHLEKGRLVASAGAPQEFVGAVFQGTDSDGQPVHVALCDAAPRTTGSSLVWYRVELWNGRSGAWENPCIATGQVPAPRALAVPGVWDKTGAHQDKPGKFTFACENGAIAKCIDWGYMPWAMMKDGRSLAELHQACTRMARADYCGDGRSHTHENNLIDMYDDLKVLTRTTEASREWSPDRATFEAAWAVDGAWCLARTREGQPVESVLAQCPGRFQRDVKDLGEGDRCVVRREGEPNRAMIRNRSYDNGERSPREVTPRD